MAKVAAWIVIGVLALLMAAVATLNVSSLCRNVRQRGWGEVLKDGAVWLVTFGCAYAVIQGGVWALSVVFGGPER